MNGIFKKKKKRLIASDIETIEKIRPSKPIEKDGHRNV